MMKNTSVLRSIMILLAVAFILSTGQGQEGDMYEEELPAAQSLRIFRISFLTMTPTARYKNYTSRTLVGLNLGLVYPAKNRDFFYGFDFTYAYHDGFTSQYTDVDASGFPRRVEEFAGNHHFALDASGYYMPEWFDRIQPYGKGILGIRRVHTRIRISDLNTGNQINSLTYQGTFMAQVGAGIGIKFKVRSLIFDTGLAYVESTPGTHLLRKKDWRNISVNFATDAFDKRRVPLQLLQWHLSAVFIL